MADGLQVKLTGAWDSFEDALDARAFEKRLDRELLKAHRSIGRRYVTLARRGILAGNYAANSPLTIALKGSQRHLLATGGLMRAIGFEATARQLNVGIDPSKAGPELQRRAILLHEGATIDTRKHPRVRRAVFAKLRDTGRQAPRIRSGSSGGIWRIPGRPFLLEPLNSPAFVRLTARAWTKAVERALFPPGVRTR